MSHYTEELISYDKKEYILQTVQHGVLMTCLYYNMKYSICAKMTREKETPEKNDRHSAK